MTLLQAVTPTGPRQDPEELADTVRARLAYLVRRAKGLAEAAVMSNIAVATLWLDACETASFLAVRRRECAGGGAPALSFAGH